MGVECARQTERNRGVTQFPGDGSNITVVSSTVARTVVGKPGVEDPSILAYASTDGSIEALVKNWAAMLGPRYASVW